MHACASCTYPQSEPFVWTVHIRDHLNEDEQQALWEYVVLEKHPPNQPIEKRAIWKLKELAKATGNGGGLEDAKRKADEFFERPSKVGRMGD